MSCSSSFLLADRGAAREPSSTPKSGASLGGPSIRTSAQAYTPSTPLRLPRSNTACAAASGPMSRQRARLHMSSAIGRARSGSSVRSSVNMCATQRSTHASLSRTSVILIPGARGAVRKGTDFRTGLSRRECQKTQTVFPGPGRNHGACRLPRAGEIEPPPTWQPRNPATLRPHARPRLLPPPLGA